MTHIEAMKRCMRHDNLGIDRECECYAKGKNGGLYCTAIAATEESSAVQEPVAWALEWSFNGEETGRRLYDDETHCKFDAGNDGGVCRPLIYGDTHPQPKASATQEPVAWVIDDVQFAYFDLNLAKAQARVYGGNVKPLFAQPKREWVGLTDEEVVQCQQGNIYHFYRCIEAKLKEKNT